jgi:dienelactone hydrolase
MAAMLMAAATMATAGQQMWDVADFSDVPQTWPAPEFATEGVEALFYEGPDYRGEPTRVFAYVGVPEVEDGETVPGMVLIHGGGGTAFDEWVRIWNERGYAAIAMDTAGGLPGGEPGERPRNEHGGPPGWGGWKQVGDPMRDQWTWHAVADVLLAHSLLAARPEVDADRIGVTGISWGGYLTSIVAGVDPRLKLAVPVYGCGFYEQCHYGPGVMSRLADDDRQRWLDWWDPKHYLADADLPMLWLSGTNDFAFWLPGLQSSYRATPPDDHLAIRLRMAHGHTPGWTPREIYAFADSILRDGPPLPRVTGQGREGGLAWMTVEGPAALESAELLYTRDTDEHWPDREWETVSAQIDGTRVSADLPEGTAVYFLNATDERGLLASGEHEVLP